LLIIYSQSLFAQIDESEIKIVTKAYYYYEFSKYETYDNIYDDTEDRSSEDSILRDVVEIYYPNIQTPDSKLNTFINDAILKNVGVDIENSVSNKMDRSYDSLEEMPSVTYTTFTINYISSLFISLTINQNGEACCGASGASHHSIPLTFDLVNKKIICFEDVIRKKQYEKAYNILVDQYTKNTSDEIQLEKYIDQGYLQTLLKTPVVVFADKMIVYQNVSYGGKSVDITIAFEYEKYADLFNKEFLMKINKKN